MKKISIKIYNLFLIYGSELLWVDDSLRYKRPNGTTKETDEMFIFLEKVDHNLEMIATGLYNKKLTNDFINIVNNYKKLISKEVFELMNDKYQGIKKQTEN